MNSGNEGEMSCRGGADLHLTSHHPLSDLSYKQLPDETTELLLHSIFYDIIISEVDYLWSLMIRRG